MFFNHLCAKVYLWPFLSYLANFKELCQIKQTITPTFPTSTTSMSTSMRTSTKGTPISTTTRACSQYPVTCLANGTSPIKNCPCIDPRQLDKMKLMSNGDFLIFSPLEKSHDHKTLVDGSLCSGHCKPLKQCSVLMKNFNNIVNNFSTLLCGFDGINILVCCKHEDDEKIHTQTKELQISTEDDYGDIEFDGGTTYINITND